MKTFAWLISNSDVFQLHHSHLEVLLSLNDHIGLQVGNILNWIARAGILHPTSDPRFHTQQRWIV
jgi:hypothetical protein